MLLLCSLSHLKFHERTNLWGRPWYVCINNREKKERQVRSFFLNQSNYKLEFFTRTFYGSSFLCIICLNIVRFFVCAPRRKDRKKIMELNNFRYWCFKFNLFFEHVLLGVEKKKKRQSQLVYLYFFRFIFSITRTGRSVGAVFFGHFQSSIVYWLMLFHV